MSPKKQILVVEDHSALRIVLSNYLGKIFNVRTTANGYEALAWINEGNIPDLIILDIVMPDLDGVEFLTNIRNSGFFQHIPVVLVSAEEDKKLIEKCIELGINGYLKKPFNPADLQTKILTILKKNKNTIETPNV